MASLPEFKDKARHTLKAGDLIVYGHALGRCASLQYGKVLAVKQVKLPDYRAERSDYQSKLLVQGVDSGWDNNEDVNKREWKLLRKGTLEFSDRVLRITRDQVPSVILKLFDAVEVVKGA